VQPTLKKRNTAPYKIINLFKYQPAPLSLQTKRMKKIFCLILVCVAFLQSPFITGCANIIPPTGGPKDSLPPVLLKAVPDMNTSNMSGNKVLLTFDEYIDMKDIRKNLIVSPVPKIMPTVTSHLKVVTIIIKDTLEPNTTYSLNFGRAITDVNEGNVLKNFTYVFATGEHIDSAIYSGRVIMANNGKPDSTLIAILHDKLDDSAIAKTRPRYIARLDSLGNYTFRYVKPGIYALYALKDESGTHEYTSKAQVFAFADSPIDLTKPTEPITIYAYSDTSGFKTPKKALLSTPPKKEDKDKIKRLAIAGNAPGAMLDLHDQFEFSFAVPIKYYDSAKIRFTDDSFVNLSGYHFGIDSSKKKLTVYYAWAPGTHYHFILQKDFAEDTAGLKLLKIDTIAFATKKASDYGNLRLRFRNLDLSRHPVLQFVQAEKILESDRIGKSLRYNNKLFNPGEYELRILYDTNENGVWDPGDFYKHLQPEIVVPVKRKINVKSDWDNEVDITL
jgi:Bacterial Ig-like domain